jgi:MYXO-CTERM domain-containing protein
MACSGSTTTDAGTTGTDAGTSPGDASTSPDSGSGNPADDASLGDDGGGADGDGGAGGNKFAPASNNSGCGCSTPQNGARGGAEALAGLVALAWLARARRTRGRDVSGRSAG